MKYPNRGGRQLSGVSGFSLLEMLAVIVLIGIVAGIVVNQVGKNVDKGKWNAGKSQVAKLSMQIESYALDNGGPPGNLEDLVKKPSNSPNWKSGYAKESDLKDPFGHPFGFRAPGEHGDFDIVFYGKDGKQGGEEYNADFGNWQ
ncbi:MAG: type II secretion system major pseudopilin GspG [Tahibacter sp.]